MLFGHVIQCMAIKSPNGYKTRPFNKVLSEVRNVFDIHEKKVRRWYSYCTTGQDVIECVGGAQAISEVNLKIDIILIVIHD